MVTASTIYMSLMGPNGLRRVATLCHQRTRELVDALTTIPGVEVVFEPPYFHEVLLRVNQPVKAVLSALASEGIQGGFALNEAYPELADCLLLCVTETKRTEDIKRFAHALRQVLAGSFLSGSKAACQA